MQPLLVLVLAVHVLSAVFWAGVTFAVARAGSADLARLFRPQMGAAGMAILSGAYLWSLTHAAGFGHAEKVLTVGAVSAVLALGVQIAGVGPSLRAGPAATGASVSRAVVAYRMSAGLLAVALLAMATARYV